MNNLPEKTNNRIQNRNQTKINREYEPIFPKKRKRESILHTQSAKHLQDAPQVLYFYLLWVCLL